MKNAHTREDLKYYQSLPLNLKIAMSKRRIRDFIREYGESGVCVLRGGKFGKDGNWIPHNGLGFWFVIKWLNVHGNLGIELPNENEYIEKYGTEETAKHLVTDKLEEGEIE